jgi:hypothetical protein
MEPASPFTCFRYFDFLLLLIIAIFNLVLWKYHIIKISNWKITFLTLVVLVFLFPWLSTKVEVANVYRKYSMIDGFNLWYILLTWPIWWFIGIMELLFLKNIIKKRN